MGLCQWNRRSGVEDTGTVSTAVFRVLDDAPVTLRAHDRPRTRRGGAAALPIGLFRPSDRLSGSVVRENERTLLHIAAKQLVAVTLLDLPHIGMCLITLFPAHPEYCD